MPLHGLAVPRPQTGARSGTTPAGPGMPPAIAEPAGDGERLRELVARVGTGERVDPDVAEVLYALTDAFLSSLLHTALRLAAHRGSHVLEERDVAVALERFWGIVVPGFGDLPMPPPAAAGAGPGGQGQEKGDKERGGGGEKAGAKRKR
ncbi:hypothetical protein DFJ74DRAFT_654336 [Hyaloraphidium curvatum]|nr:hypothetical protein DFJ74DRAFT_654336 [Hyaloraphidium curvatum]